MTRNSTAKKDSSASSSTTTRSKSRILDWPDFYEHEAALMRAKSPKITSRIVMKRVSAKWRKQKAELLEEAREEAEGEGEGEGEKQAQKEEK